MKNPRNRTLTTLITVFLLFSMLLASCREAEPGPAPVTTDAPATDPVTTAPAVTDPPVTTAPPATNPPATTAPETDPLATTAPPVTDPPVTNSPTTTAPPETEPPLLFTPYQYQVYPTIVATKPDMPGFGELNKNAAGIRLDNVGMADRYERWYQPHFYTDITAYGLHSFDEMMNKYSDDDWFDDHLLIVMHLRDNTGSYIKGQHTVPCINEMYPCFPPSVTMIAYDDGKIWMELNMPYPENYYDYQVWYGEGDMMQYQYCVFIEFEKANVPAEWLDAEGDVDCDFINAPIDFGPVPDWYCDAPD